MNTRNLFNAVGWTFASKPDTSKMTRIAKPQESAWVRLLSAVSAAAAAGWDWHNCIRLYLLPRCACGRLATCTLWWGKVLEDLNVCCIWEDLLPGEQLLVKPFDLVSTLVWKRFEWFCLILLSLTVSTLWKTTCTNNFYVHHYQYYMKKLLPKFLPRISRNKIDFESCHTKKKYVLQLTKFFPNHLTS